VDCKAFSKATEIASASMTGIDGYGFEMSAKTNDGPRPVRLASPKPVSTPEKRARGPDLDISMLEGTPGASWADGRSRKSQRMNRTRNALTGG
jgi:hypothetical protein